MGQVDGTVSVVTRKQGTSEYVSMSDTRGHRHQSIARLRSMVTYDLTNATSGSTTVYIARG